MMDANSAAKLLLMRLIPGPFLSSPGSGRKLSHDDGWNLTRAILDPFSRPPGLDGTALMKTA